MDKNKKTIVIKVGSELHYQIKKLALEKRSSIQDYMLSLIMEDFKKEGIECKETKAN